MKTPTNELSKGGITMKHGRVIIYIILSLMIVGLSGCIGVNNGFRGIRSSIINSLGGDFDTEIEFSIGPAGIFLASTAAGFAKNETDVNISEMLSQIARVQVGVYEWNGNGDIKPSIGLLRKISQKMTAGGWQSIVRSVSGNEMTSVFVQTTNENHINQVFVVALDGDELVITEVLGNLDNIIEIAVRDHGHNLKFAGR